MSADLRRAAAEYLRLRRSLGYQLADHDWLIAAFLDHVYARGHTSILVEDALSFAQAPTNTSRRWHAQRLAVVRGLATYVHSVDPTAAQLVPPDLIHASGACRRVPYLYTPAQIAALMTQAETLRSPLGASMATLIGLMAVTGMRTCEARLLDVDGLDINQRLLAVTGKYGKRRILPLHPSTVRALVAYLPIRATITATSTTGPLLVNHRGERLSKNTVTTAFRHITAGVNLPTRPGAPTSRLYDLRHTFAVNSLIDAHRQGVDVDARIAVLATYLGHSNPVHTYWYLSSTADLMELVRTRVSADRQEP